MSVETLADQVMAACARPNRDIAAYAGTGREVAVWLSSTLRRARRYNFHDDATRAATRLGVQHPMLLAQLLISARPPMEVMWLEWSPRAEDDEDGRDSPTDTPLKAGCIIERIHDHRNLYRITMVGTGSLLEPLSISILPFSYIFDVDGPLTAEDRQPGLEIASTFSFPAAVLPLTLIGHAYGDLTDKMEELRGHMTFIGAASTLVLEPAFFEEMKVERKLACNRLTEHASYVWAPVVGQRFASLANSRDPDRRQNAGDAFRTLLHEFTGQWRFVVSAIALMNNPDIVDTDTVQRTGRSRSVGARTVPYLESQFVTLKLTRNAVVERILRETAGRLSPRRHNVDGHWRY